MKRLIATLVLAGALAVPAGTAAAAEPLPPWYGSPIKECGNGYSVRNITVRNLNCGDARRMVRYEPFITYGDYTFRLRWNPRYRCRVHVSDPFDRHGRGSYWVDVRCTSWIYVLRWQYHSGE